MAVHTYEEVIARLKKRCDDFGGQAKLAAEIGVSPAYMSAVISGSKPIGPKITAYLGLDAITIYKDKEEERENF